MGNEKLSTKNRVLQILRSKPECFSGQFMAEECGIARTSVWKAVQSLNQAGYKIASQKNGYRLLKDKSDSLDPWEFGESEEMFLHFNRTESTMDEARKLILDGTVKDTEIITADIQTAGRGRQSRRWQTTKGSLAFTLLTKNSLPVFKSHRTVIAAQIALVNVLRQVSGKDFFVRWPNDIWSKKGKVSGILDELAASGGICSWQNLGIGVNITRIPKLEKTDSVFNSEVKGARSKILSLFYSEFKKLEDEVFSETGALEKQWNSLCMDLNKKVALTYGSGKSDAGGTKKFFFRGIDSYGSAVFSAEREGGLKKIYAPGTAAIKKEASV